MTDAHGPDFGGGRDESEGRTGLRTREDRIAVDAVVTLNADCRGLEGTACDVSEHGLKIAIDEPVATGPVTVKLVGMPIVSGEVRWRREHYVGIRWEQPLTPDVLAHWLKWHGGRR